MVRRPPLPLRLLLGLRRSTSNQQPQSETLSVRPARLSSHDMATSSTAMARQVVGSEFRLRRLQRAAAIPAAERAPDVAAFVESVQLLREACDLLPLTSDDSPALHLGSAQARQQVALALLKWVRAHYICPADPVSDREVGSHFEAYCRGLNMVECNELDAVLLRYTFLQHNQEESIQSVISTAVALLDQLAAPAQQQAVSGQLAQLAAAYPGQPLLTCEQLHHACCCAALRAVQIPVQAPLGTPHQAQRIQHSAAQSRAAAAIMSRAAATMLSLEPQNPKSYGVAAAAETPDAEKLTAALAAQRLLRAVELYLQGAQLARQQGNTSLDVCCAAAAVGHASFLAHMHRASWQAALAAFGGAEAAVRACKPLLPAYWVGNLEAEVQGAQQAIQVVHGQLHIQSSTGSAGGNFAALAGISESTVASCLLSTTCDGCGQQAVGLRRCARCKKAQYCSTECQHKHWRTHKRECRKG